MDNTDKKIHTYYRSQRLSSAQLHSIIKGGKSKIEASSPPPSFTFLYNYRWATRVVEVAVVVFAIFLYIHKPITYKYAEEVVYNHKKQASPTFVSHDIKTIYHQMSKLNFKLELPTRNLDGLTLVGAKYCHIDSNIAAQIKLKNGHHSPYTLYAFKPDYIPPFIKEHSSESWKIQRINVKVWKEGRIVYALASNMKD